MHGTMIDVACPVCGADATDPYSEENGFLLLRCRGCDLLYVTPRPDPDTTAAAHQYGLHEGDATLAVTGRYRPDRVEPYLRILRDVHGSSLPPTFRRWLDLGCGHGEFLTALRRFAGDDVSLLGLEPNATKAHGCTTRGLDVRSVTLGEVDGSFSAISLLNVFSHLQDPTGFIAECVARLEPGGEFLLETGDTADLAAADHPRPLFLPDHLLFANERIVRRVLTEVGLQVVSVHHYSAASAVPVQVIRECQRALQRRDVPPVLAATRRWVRERRRRIDMYIRARRPD